MQPLCEKYRTEFRGIAYVPKVGIEIQQAFSEELPPEKVKKTENTSDNVCMPSFSSDWINKLKIALEAVLNSQSSAETHVTFTELCRDCPDLSWLVPMLVRDNFLIKKENADDVCPYYVSTKGFALYLAVCELRLSPEELITLPSVIKAAMMQNNSCKLLAALVGTASTSLQ